MLKSIIKYKILDICIENVFDALIKNFTVGKSLLTLHIGQKFSKIKYQEFFLYNCEITEVEYVRSGTVFSTTLDYMVKETNDKIAIFMSFDDSVEFNIKYLEERNIKYYIFESKEEDPKYQMTIYDTYENFKTYEMYLRWKSIEITDSRLDLAMFYK